MTNITVAILVTVATNWSGLVYQADKEVGFIVTNHVARIEYAGKTNEFTLLSEPSNIYTLRPMATLTGTAITWSVDDLIVTNCFTNWIAPLTGDMTNWSKAQ